MSTLFGESLPRPRAVQADGAAPFTTRRRFRYAGVHDVTQESREHRKGLHRHALDTRQSDWLPRNPNIWIGLIFALGATLFSLASLLVLSPALAAQWFMDEHSINHLFFCGSIPFTIAAGLQVLQAEAAGDFAMVDPSRHEPYRPLLWRLGDPGWLSCATQFAGTVWFNVNTYEALNAGTEWLRVDATIWVPHLIGSVLFLIAAHLAFIEVCHAHWAWQPKRLAWWISFINLLGSLAFMASALLAFTPPHNLGMGAEALSVRCTLAGALAFLIAALLLLPEATADYSQPRAA